MRNVKIPCLGLLTNIGRGGSHPNMHFVGDSESESESNHGFALKNPHTLRRLALYRYLLSIRFCQLDNGLIQTSMLQC